MAQQKPDPKLIDSMAMRYRHDFGLLEEPHKEAIRTTMKQLWEEVVGLGFYKDEQFGNSEQLAQQKLVNSKHLESSSAKNAQVETAVEWFYERLERMIPRTEMYNRDKIIYLEQAKKMFEQQIIKAVDVGFDEGCKFPEDIKLGSGEQYYNETYGK
jgi:hypothetical protein